MEMCYMIYRTMNVLVANGKKSNIMQQQPLLELLKTLQEQSLIWNEVWNFRNAEEAESIQVFIKKKQSIWSSKQF